VLEALGLPATIFIVAGAPAAGEGFWWDEPAIVRRPLAERWDLLNRLGGDAERILATERITPTARLPALTPAPWTVVRAAAGRPTVTIGAHSVSHRALTELPAEAVTAELTESREAIRQAVGTTPDLFAFPYGLWNAAVSDAARAAGYRAAVTLADRVMTGGDKAWALPRINVPTGLSMDAFASWLVDFRPGRWL
jgi:peptidoglycan/xylan/chitin deacetylase (PgdA/CDA1 family)